MRRRVLYGWRKPGGSYCVSRTPPDSPTSANIEFQSIADAEASAGSKMEIVWSGEALGEKLKADAARRKAQAASESQAAAQRIAMRHDWMMAG